MAERRKIIFGPTKEISTLKYVLLILLFDALPSAIVFILAYDIIYNFSHSFILSAFLSALISSTLGAHYPLTLTDILCYHPVVHRV